MDPITLALLGLGAAGTLGQAWSQDRAGKRAAQSQSAIRNRAFGMMAPDPFAGEMMLRNFIESLNIGGGEAAPTMGEGFNVGQDALMQMLRADGGVQMDANLTKQLEEILAGGPSFDTSPLFDALQTQDERRARSATADLRAGASGLGQRFGTALMRAEGDTRAQLAENAGARDASLVQQMWEAAQGRRLGAGQILAGREQTRLGAEDADLERMLRVALGLQEGGLQEGQFNQQNFGLGLNQQNQMANFLSMLFNMEQGRRGGNANLLGIAAGQPGVAGPSAIPGAGADMAQMIMLMRLLGQE